MDVGFILLHRYCMEPVVSVSLCNLPRILRTYVHVDQTHHVYLLALKLAQSAIAYRSAEDTKLPVPQHMMGRTVITTVYSLLGQWSREQRKWIFCIHNGSTYCLYTMAIRQYTPRSRPDPIRPDQTSQDKTRSQFGLITVCTYVQ